MAIWYKPELVIHHRDNGLGVVVLDYENDSFIQNGVKYRKSIVIREKLFDLNNINEVNVSKIKKFLNDENIKYNNASLIFQIDEYYWCFYPRNFEKLINERKVYNQPKLSLEEYFIKNILE